MCAPVAGWDGGCGDTHSVRSNTIYFVLSSFGALSEILWGRCPSQTSGCPGDLRAEQVDGVEERKEKKKKK